MQAVARQSLAWLGDGPPPPLSAALQDLADLREGWEPSVRVVAVWTPSGVEQLEGLPRPGARPPIIAVSPTRPTVRERLAWIRAGADSVIEVSEAAESILRTLYPDGPPPRPTPPEPELAPDPPTPPDGEPALDQGDAPLVIDSSLPEALEAGDLPVLDFLTEFSPDDESSHGVLSRADRARLQAVLHYLERRAVVAARLGPGGLAELLEVCRLRDLAERGRADGRSADTFGQTRGVDTPPLRWLCTVMSDSEGAALEPSIVLSLGTDGMAFSLPRPVAANQPLRVMLPVATDATVTFIVETRWQRRVSASTWHIGASIHQMTLIGPPT